MKSKKLFKNVVMGAVLSVALVGSVASAANYKFGFTLTTKIFHGAVYSDPATKYTKTENPVLKVEENSSGVPFQFTVVNSDGAARTNTLKKSNKGHWTFSDNTTAKGYRYRLKVSTDAGNFWNVYTVKGDWNIDTY